MIFTFLNTLFLLLEHYSILCIRVPALKLCVRIPTVYLLVRAQLLTAGCAGAAGVFAAGSTTGCTGTAAGLAADGLVIVVGSFGASLCGHGGSLQLKGSGTASCAWAMRREAAASAGSGKSDHFGRLAFGLATYLTGLNLSQFSVHGCIGGHTAASFARNSDKIVLHCSTSS